MPRKVATEAAAFAEKLIGAASRYPIGESRLVKMVQSGRVGRSVLRRVAAATLTGAARFPGQLASLTLLADDPRARVHLLDNLLEESGVRIVSGRGMVASPETSHVSWATVFARAVGLDDAAIAEASIAPAADPVFDSAVLSGDWLGGLTYLSALEFNVPRSFGPMIEGFHALGLPEADLVFFTRHLTADEGHGRDSLAMCAALAVERCAQSSALQHAQRAAERWWRSHDGMHGRNERSPARAI